MSQAWTRIWPIHRRRRIIDRLSDIPRTTFGDRTSNLHITAPSSVSHPYLKNRVERTTYHQHCSIQELSEWRLAYCGSSPNFRLGLSRVSLFTRRTVGIVASRNASIGQHLQLRFNLSSPRRRHPKTPLGPGCCVLIWDTATVRVGGNGK